MRPAIWYFDFVSPFACIGLHRLGELPRALPIEYRPVLFAGLLNRFGQKGPAEIAAKRRYTYRWCHWWAQSRGIPLRFPAAHPFNPLHHLRLAIACGCAPEAVRRIFQAIWTTGADPTDPAAFSRLALELGVDAARLGAPEVKDALRRNTEDAAARGVFGVPTLEVAGEPFWGADAIDFARAFLADPSVLHNDEMHRLDCLPVAAARRT
ncbi:MAG: 2-hydroxychromene-2-carboxylate isomerase [Betaproteobacteria bacterium]|nr:MAG: 2-hydroxychromene-2-carboxylate isomerase [Betaproteobacteria bacterium]